jgi:hypothetical protein
MDQDWYPAFALEWQEQVQTVWPEITAPVYFIRSQADRIQLVSDVMQGNVLTPFAMADFGLANFDPQWGLGNEFFRYPLTAWWIAKLSQVTVLASGGTEQSYVNNKAFLLRAWIDNDAYGLGFNTFRAIERGTVDSSGDNPFNARQTAGQLQFMGASVMWNPGLLVGQSGPYPAVSGELNLTP